MHNIQSVYYTLEKMKFVYGVFFIRNTFFLNNMGARNISGTLGIIKEVLGEHTHFLFIVKR